MHHAWNMYGAPSTMYDWVSPGSHNRTPQESPYGYSGHFLWRTFELGDPTVSGVYSDRMAQWDMDKWSQAMVGRRQTWDTLDRASAAAIIKSYYGDNVDLVGYAVECNVSNGYPLGIFFLRDKT